MTISASKARANFADLFRRCVEDSEPVRITNKNKEIVCMNAQDWDAWQETLLLLSSPSNAAHLFKSIEEMNQGETTGMTLEQLDEFLEK